MLEIIQHWDTFYFNLINQEIANPVFDFILPYFREKLFWIPLYVFIIVFCIKKYGLKQGLVLILGMLFCIALADGIANLFKYNFQRLRPCHVVETARQLVNCGSGKSFISAHAANHFALASFWITAFFQYKWLKPAALTWAFLISFAQIYVGVHYPLDVIVGSFVGTFIGTWLAYSALTLVANLKAEEEK